VKGDLEGVPDDFPPVELLLALVGGQPPVALGSAVWVAPGVALTASHVIEEYWKQFGEVDEWRASKAATFPIQAIQYLPHEKQFVTWHVFFAAHRDDLDICLLQLTPEEGHYPTDHVWAYPTLDRRPVVKGTPVQAFGFPKSDVVFDTSTNGWVLQHALGGSVGEVTDVFAEGRDRAKKPFPCFEMNIEIRGGMSGGPVVNLGGNIFRVVSTGWVFTEPGPHSSGASMLDPALGLPLIATGNLGGEGEQLTLGDLQRRGYLITVGP